MPVGWRQLEMLLPAQLATSHNGVGGTGEVPSQKMLEVNRDIQRKSKERCESSGVTLRKKPGAERMREVKGHGYRLSRRNRMSIAGTCVSLRRALRDERKR